MRRRRKPAGETDLHNRLAGPLQLSARLEQPQIEVILGGHSPEILSKEPLELPPRHADKPGNLIGSQRILDIGFHEQQRVVEPRMPLARRSHKRNPLAFLATPQGPGAERIGNPLREIRPMFAADHRQHEIDGSLPARTGRPIAIDLEDLLRDDRPLELLGELLIRLPVHAHAIPGKLPRHREPPHAVMNPGHDRRALPDPRETREKQPIVGKLLKPLRHDDQPVARDRIVERRIGMPLRAAGERHGPPVPRTHLPAIQQAPVDLVREIQRIDDRPHTRHRHGRQCNDRHLRRAGGACGTSHQCHV
ncbi:hypothetical protein BamMEX5DRAFT_7098 [Burkholderia ambifaria MEX-5]|uniref:Uncharacterized protein n=1 Tax=Burkholderia ambifaria MEX-5 TaxID=396597 RepID=B1TH31_9BURK|nr:hypothetical protein BamMEX5DRAFT_7098 [Burkholderia ambifaria MEX-5]